MTSIVEDLLALQGIELGTKVRTPPQAAEVERLRAQIPAALLEKFDRWVRRGKRAVAVIRNGVCSECHLRLPSGNLPGLASTTEIHYCNNCGRLLFVPEEEASAAPVPPRKPAIPPASKRGRRRAAVATGATSAAGHTL